MQVLKYTDYGLRVLMYLGASPEAPVPAAQVAAAYGISADHVAKAAKRLVQLGVVKAARGAGGGLMLAQPAEKIRIGAVVRRFEAGRGPVECFRTAAPVCRIVSGCLLRGAFDRAAEAYYRELDRHSLADLLENRPTLVRLLAPRTRASRPRA
jgi:Rrf2 family transcriptional regulator, nitric oxide-sensitive transcriptional repressor